MLDRVSMETFIAAVDEGSFSAAARRLNRVQSAVNGWIGGLEEQIGVVLFDRLGRFPRLTLEGVLLLQDARNVVSGVDTLKARAKLMASGLEAEITVVIDVFFPSAVGPPGTCDAVHALDPHQVALLLADGQSLSRECIQLRPAKTNQMRCSSTFA